MASVALSSKAVGSIVKLNVGGVAKNFIVVHQGRPSSLYDTSCDGTWLLMEDCYESKRWHSSNVNDYANSEIRSYLNSTFLNLFDANIKSAIKQVKLPYRAGSGYGTTITSGANGLSTKIFLLSGPEVNWTSSTHSYIPNDGACLSYFSGCATTDAKRIAKLNGSAVSWWLRSPYCGSNYGATNALRVGTNGSWDGRYCSNSYGIRPALVLPSSLLVSDDGSISTNTAPTVPSSITVPGSIMGGSTITVKWGTSTDKENNLSGYKVEKSTNGGSTWSQIYQGTATQTTDAVAFGTASVMYRVRAYDSDGLHSGYKTSSQVTVVNNVAPGAPPAISVPNEVKGGASLIVSWSAASDSDGNLSGYILERCINGGTEWTQVYKGNTLSYTDTITKGWTKVKYRVKAYDAYNAASGYTTSAERTVDNNTPPTITCSSADGADLGMKASGFSITYSVDDVDTADTLTVTEKMDGAVKRTFTATRKTNNSFAVTGDYFQKLLNGQHTMVIQVTDGKVTVTRTLRFTKKVTRAVITLETPMEADAQITICAINVMGSIPADAAFSVKVTNNGKDSSPVWEDATTAAKNGVNHIFTNKTAANGFAFNFRVEVERGASGEGGHITSIQGGFQ